MLLQGVMNNPTMMGELLSQLGGAGGGFGGVAADGGGATSPAACGPAGGGEAGSGRFEALDDPLEALLTDPTLADLRESAKAPQVPFLPVLYQLMQWTLTPWDSWLQVIADIRAHGAMAALMYSDDGEAAAIFGRINRAAGPGGLATLDAFEAGN
jgi:hypothetical protein